MERIRSIPSIPVMASSTRMHTPSSTSAGAAPRYGTRIVIIWVSRSGNTLTGIRDSESSPPTSRNSMRMFAAT